MDTAVDIDTLREKTLAIAKQHKASWIALGQHLYTIYHDKHYRNWGYLNFETYCVKELHLKQTTAVKVLKSYYFLEKEKPELVTNNPEQTASLPAPNYESVNLLRLAANNKKLDERNIQALKKAVFESEKEPADVRAQMKRMLSEREEKDSREVRRDRRNQAIKRLITVLSNTKKDLEHDHLLPEYLLKQISDLVSKLEDQVEE